jgi:hypothetical protein
MISGRPYVRRNEFTAVIALLLLLIFLLCPSSESVAVAKPAINTPVVVTPPPAPTPAPPIIEPTPRPCPRVIIRRCHWHRPGYVKHQPVRNVFRFLFVRRIRCG